VAHDGAAGTEPSSAAKAPPADEVSGQLGWKIKEGAPKVSDRAAKTLQGLVTLVDCFPLDDIADEKVDPASSVYPVPLYCAPA